MSWLTSTGQPTSEGGNNVGGATSVTLAPSVEKAITLERATRLWRMSPTIAIRSPDSTGRPRRRVPEAALPLPADREAVQERLSRVFVGAVAGV